MKAVQDALSGAHLRQVELLDHTWFFRFDNDVVIGTETYWRVLANGRIAVAECDHGHQFGLPAPVDAAREARRRLNGPVTSASVDERTGDLRVSFADQAALELFNTSAGYEGWHLTSATGEFVAVGGGEVRPIRVVSS